VAAATEGVPVATRGEALTVECVEEAVRANIKNGFQLVGEGSIIRKNLKFKRALNYVDIAEFLKFFKL